MGDGALAGMGLAEPRVVGEEVGVDGPVGDLRVADGTEDGFGHVVPIVWTTGTGRTSAPEGA